MPYEAALDKAWTELEKIAGKKDLAVKFLADTYGLNPKERAISSLSCNVPAKDFLKVLLLHYMTGTAKKPFVPSGEWVSFKDIEGGEIYYPAFREGAIKPLLRKYGSDPKGILGAAGRLGGKAVESGDAAVEFGAFEDMKVRVVLWKGDDEFGPEATMLFDKNITSVFTMEDIAVLGRFIVHSI